MSKKTWSTILVVVLVIAAVVGIYFATRKDTTPAPTATPVAATDVPVTDAPATDAPATDVPATDAPAADAAEDKIAEVAEAVETKAEEAVEAVETKAEEVVAAVETKAEEVVEETKELAAEAGAAVAGAADAAEEKAAEVAKAVETKAEDAVAAVKDAVSGKQKVAIWHTFTKAQEEYLVKAAADFTASQDKIEVEVLSQPYDGFTNAVYSAVNSDVGPDIIFNYASEAVKYIPAGKVADLSQYIYDADIGIEGFDEALAKTVLDGEVKGFSDGLIHYLPAYTTGPIYFYNKTLFDELELKAPTSWEELETVVTTIYKKKNIAGLGTDSLTDIAQQLIMESENSGYIDAANKAVLFDTKEVREKLQWLVDLAKKGYVELKPAAKYFSDDFNAGTIASFIGSVAGYPYVNPADGAFTFDVAPMPTKDWYPSWNRGPIVFYYGDDARAEAAYEFVKYFISADVNAGWVEAVVALAPYKWTEDTEAYKAYVAQENPEVAALEAVQVNLDKVQPLPNVTGAAQVRDYITDALIKAASGDVTLDAAWDEAVKLSNEALKGN